MSNTSEFVDVGMLMGYFLGMATEFLICMGTIMVQWNILTEFLKCEYKEQKLHGYMRSYELMTARVYGNGHSFGAPNGWGNGQGTVNGNYYNSEEYPN